MKKILVVIGLVGTFTACSSPVDFGGNTRRELIPTDFHRNMWNRVEDCTGLEGNFNSVTWYLSDSITHDGNEYGGVYNKDENSITLRTNLKEHGKTVSHEINHALGLDEHNADDGRFVCEFVFDNP